MKKLIIALACMLALTSCFKQEDFIYTISSGVSEASISGSSSAAGKQIFNEYSSQVSDIISSNKSNWTWIVTNAKKSDDNAAKTKYQKYADQIESLTKEYQTKLDACGDTKTVIAYTGFISVTREDCSGNTETLAKTTVSLSLN